MYALLAAQHAFQFYDFRARQHHDAGPVIVIHHGEQVMLVIIPGKGITGPAAYPVHAAAAIDGFSGQPLPCPNGGIGERCGILQPAEPHASGKGIGEHGCTGCFLICFRIGNDLSPEP